jgi:hypothetical protein
MQPEYHCTMPVTQLLGNVLLDTEDGMVPVNITNFSYDIHMRSSIYSQEPKTMNWTAHLDPDPHRELILRKKYALEFHICPFHRGDMIADREGGHFCAEGDCVTTYLYHDDFIAGYTEEKFTDEWLWMHWHLTRPANWGETVQTWAESRLYENWGHALTANKVSRGVIMGL